MSTETQTDTSTDTSEGRGTRAREFDHEAIAADLAAEMSVKDIAEKHGCSASLVQRIRRRSSEGGDDRTPSNTRRAVALRKKVSTMQKDFDLLAKWAPNETDAKEVSTIVALLEDVADKLGEAADKYEALPAGVMKAKRASTKTVFEPGQIVSTKEKYRETYAGICSNPEHLTVKGFRDTHVLVEDDKGVCLFVPAKELELRKDA